MLRTILEILLVVAFVGVALFAFDMGADYETYIETTEAQIQQLEAQVVQTGLSLEGVTAELEEEKHEKELLSQEVSRLTTTELATRGQLIEFKNETLGLVKLIEDYKKEIELSMKWFTENAGLGETSMEETVKSRIVYECMHMKRDECQIKTGCFYLLNEERWDITYKTDEQTSGRADKLMAIEDFLDSKGGDCEDYALFYKAELNHILGECAKNNATSITIDAWYPGDDTSGTYWLSYKKKWYFPFTNSINLKSGYVHPTVVCGNIYDLRKKKVGGHCIVAFTKNKIQTKDDIDIELRLAPVIEPQNGKYLGLIEDTSSGIYLDKGHESYLTVVITDNDYFMSTNQGWQGYSGFYEMLEHKEKHVSAML